MQEIFVIRTSYSLRGLPGWLSKRTYNTIRHGLRDKNGKYLVGLTDNVGEFRSKSGLVLVHDETLVDRVVMICSSACRGAARVIDATEDNAVYDLRRDFLSLLAENETMMAEHAAMAVTCSQLGIDEDEGYAMLNQPAEVRRA